MKLSRRWFKKKKQSKYRVQKLWTWILAYNLKDAVETFSWLPPSEVRKMYVSSEEGVYGMDYATYLITPRFKERKDATPFLDKVSVRRGLLAYVQPTYTESPYYKETYK
jgi:hypothetical protein